MAATEVFAADAAEVGLVPLGAIYAAELSQHLPVELKFCP
jgi:hypothetical protein